MRHSVRTLAPSPQQVPTSTKWFLWVLLGLLVLVLLTRLTLMPAGGALSFPDEDRYLESIKAVQLLLRGNLEQTALHLANTQGRPADAVLRLPVAFLQVLWQNVGGPPPEAPASLRLPQLINYLVLLGNVGLLYQLGRRWLTKESAVVSCLLYSALVSTNLYLRHLLPYDMALLVALGALVFLTRLGKPASVRRLGFLTGLLGWLAVAVYPGYYFALPLVGVVLLARLPRQSWPRGLAWATVGAALVLLPLELVTRYGHISYLRTLQTLAPTITQGDFSEGFTFTGTYLWQVEGPLGIALILLALPGMWLLVRPRTTKDAPLLPVVALAPLGLWLLHAALVYFAHKFVFYGRILHFFIPFLVLYAVTALAALPHTARRVAQTAVLCTALFGFGRFLPVYWPLAYPRDVLAKLAVQPTNHLSYQNENGLGHSWDVGLPPGQGRPVAPASASLLLVNFTYPYPMSISGCNTIRASLGARVLFEGPHFLTFPAYTFEGFTPAERQQLRSCNLQCRVYQW